ERLGQILVQSEHAAYRARDLRHFERVRQPGAVIVALVLDEHLGLVLEAAECRRVDDAIPVTLIAGPGGAFFLGKEAATALGWVCGIARPFRGLEQRPQK